MSIYDFESRLYPGESSEVGFLLPGQKLKDVIDADIATAAQFNVTLYQVGCVLERIVRKYDQGDYNIDDKYRLIPGISTNGYQECPFEELDYEPCTYGRSTIVIEKIETQERFFFESLVAHLVKDHNFCEGLGTQYRLDLEAAIKFFEILPNVDYTPRIERNLTWISEGSSNSLDKYEPFQSLALAEVSGFHFRAYLFPWSFHSSMKFDFSKPFLEALYETLFNEAVDLEKFGLKFCMSENPKTPEELAAETKLKVAEISHRIEQFKAGIYTPGLSVVLLGSKEQHPDLGITAAVENREKRRVRIKIPAWNFDVRESYFYVPCTYQYESRIKTRYL